MKKIFFILSSLIALNSQAYVSDCTSVCQKMTFDSDKMACLRIISGNFYGSESVCDTCNAMTFDSYKKECLKATANKFYSETALSLCSNMTFDSSKVDCLKQSGSVYNPNPQPVCDVNRLIRQAEGAIRNLDGYNYNAVRNTLMNMKEELYNCR